MDNQPRTLRIHLRKRLVDLAVVASVWALTGDVWFKFQLGWPPYLLTAAVWGVGLSLSGAYRDKPAARADLGKLTFDHVLYSVVWIGGLHIFGLHVAYSAMAAFVLAAWVGLALVRFAPRPRIGDRLRPLIRALSAFFGRIRIPLEARPVMIGILAGLAMMSVLGRWAARQSYHPNFVRLTPWATPATTYEPTTAELANIVRQQAKPGTILVICGGNSVFYGLGQPAARVWTKYLQQELGDRYSVVNFALPGASLTDGGAVIAEALRREYPKQIYLANAWPGDGGTPGGSATYRFVFWAANYGGYLIDDPSRAAAIADSLGTQHSDIKELKIRMRLDRILYFQDFWNLIAWKKLGTVWGQYPIGAIFLDPRNTRPDPEGDFLSQPALRRFPPYKDAAEMSIIRGWAEDILEPQRGATGKWRINAETQEKFMQAIKDNFPPELKRHTLIIVSRDCPYYVQKLSPDDQERDDLAVLTTIRWWKDGGYDSIDYGKDFTIDDYGDRVHLTSLGGAKLARIVAIKVRAMSANLGYLAP